MSTLSTAKEVREFYARHGQPVGIKIDALDKTDLTDAYEAESWSIEHTFADGVKLTMHWTGYSRGYSEYTPSSPGSIEFFVEEPSV